MIEDTGFGRDLVEALTEAVAIAQGSGGPILLQGCC